MNEPRLTLIPIVVLYSDHGQKEASHDFETFIRVGRIIFGGSGNALGL